jgi:hypothetical protein
VLKGDPAAAWERFAMPTRKAILRALTQRLVVYPEAAGYVMVAEWREGDEGSP